MTKLDFLIAGVQKGGTTALWHFLRQHPQIQFGHRKELHFFDDETLDWSDPPFKLLHSEYHPVEGSRLGDATPIYTYWPPSLARIKAYNPDIRLVISFRNPVERAYSHWRMETARNRETLNFSEAIRQGRQRVHAQYRLNIGHQLFNYVERGFYTKRARQGRMRLRRQKKMDIYHRLFSYVERGFYAEQLERLFGLFPAQQVLLLRQQDLVEHHQQTLDRVCDFLNVDRYSAYPAFDEVFSHRGLAIDPISAEDRAFLRSVYAADLEVMKQRHGLDLSDE